MRRKVKQWNDGYAEDIGSQVYDIGGAALNKWRRKSRDGLQTLSRADRQAYGAAVEQAVLSSQRAWLRGGAEKPTMPCNCASGTFLSDGRDISAAIRSQQKAALSRALADNHRKRTPAKWAEMYEAAMAEKRERETVAVAA